MPGLGTLAAISMLGSAVQGGVNTVVNNVGKIAELRNQQKMQQAELNQNKYLTQQQQMNNVYNSLMGNASASQSATNAYGDSWGGSSSTNRAIENGWSEGGTYGSGYNATQASLEMMREANAFNAEQAKLQREWQEHMASTAYQRTMDDLRKSGLNPILAYTNGATGGGNGASASSAMGTAYTDNMNYSSNKYDESAYSSSANGSHNEEHSWGQSTDNIRNQLENLAVVSGLQSGAILDMVMGGANRHSANDWAKEKYQSTNRAKPSHIQVERK